MALRNFVPPRNHLAQYGDQITIAGCFDVTKTTGAVGAVSSGRGWSVAKAAGVAAYDITFEGPMYARLAFVCSAEDAETGTGADDVVAVAGAYSALVQRVYLPTAGSVAAEVAANQKVNFIGVFRTRNAL